MRLESNSYCIASFQLCSVLSFVLPLLLPLLVLIISPTLEAQQRNIPSQNTLADNDALLQTGPEKPEELRVVEEFYGNRDMSKQYRKFYRRRGTSGESFGEFYYKKSRRITTFGYVLATGVAPLLGVATAVSVSARYVYYQKNPPCEGGDFCLDLKEAEMAGMGVCGGAVFLSSLITGIYLVKKYKTRMEKLEELTNGKSSPKPAAKVDFNAGLDRVSLSIAF